MNCFLQRDIMEWQSKVDILVWFINEVHKIWFHLQQEDDAYLYSGDLPRFALDDSG